MFSRNSSFSDNNKLDQELKNIVTFSQLLNVLRNFPEHKENILQFLIQPENAVRLITCSYHLCLLIDPKYFIDYKKELFQFLMQPENAHRLITSIAGLDQLAWSNNFLDHKEELFQFLMQPENAARLIQSSGDIRCLVRNFSNHKEALFQFLMQPENAARLITSSSEIRYLVSPTNFPEHKEALFQFLMQPENAARLITSSSEIGYLVSPTNFPEHKEALFQFLIFPRNFKQLVTTTKELSILNQVFPGYETIFQQPTVEEAFKEVRKISKEEQAYSSGATAGMFSEKYPSDIGYHIGSFLNRQEGAQVAQTSKEAAKIAEEERDLKRNQPGMI